MAELVDRRDPERVLMRPTDAGGLRRAWDLLEQRYPVRECLSIVLSEEWEHRRYAERDLAVREARRS